MASAMVYDEKRNVIVLYGGEGCADVACDTRVDLEDLWEWNGSLWKEIPKAGTWPGLRSRHAMAYDPSRGQVVLNGGGDGPMMSWDGSAWTEITAYCNFGCPLGRKDHAMVYHPGRGHLVVYSGIGGALNDISIQVRADSYELDGDYWRHIDTATHPDGRVGGQLAWDPTQQVMWLFGGSSEYGAGFDGYPNDVWKLDASGWTQVNKGGEPSDSLPWGRRQAIFMWHPALKQPILFGGFSYPATQIVGGLETFAALGVWTWNGAAWQKHPEWFLLQSSRMDQAAAPFPGMNLVMEFGGSANGDFPTDSQYLLGPSAL